MKNVSYYDLMENVRKYIYDQRKLEMISKAFECAEKMHKGQKRQSGEDYIIHPLSVAFILSEMEADADTICAGLLHDTIEDTKITKKEIVWMFNSVVARLVDGVTKISKMNFSSKEEQVASNTRKIITSLDEDVRIIIIKLADRLHNMRTLQYKNEIKQKENALETMEIFVPLAYYLGIYRIKSELEDLSLYYIKPDDYNKISYTLEKINDDMKLVILKMMEDIGNVLTDNNISFEYKDRIKSIYGLYTKINAGKKISDIHDLMAIKIMVEDVKTCYEVLGLVHQEFPPVNDKFKDYIARPKTNQYRSLHTTVFGLNNHLFQMQIRTFEMEKINNYGLAAYWNLYQENAGIIMQKELMSHFQFFQSISELNQITTKNEEFVENIRNEIFDKNIYVFSTNGDVVELPKGSTPNDFAYKIHTDIGNIIEGAIVNDEVVSLDYELHNKDIVRILTSSLSTGPSIVFQDKVKTTKAKKLIRENNRKFLK